METATFPINTGIMAVFHSTKCQRWEYTQEKKEMQCYPWKREAGRLERTGTILYNRECMIQSEMAQV